MFNLVVREETLSSTVPYVKFVLLDDMTVLVGRVEFHKQLIPNGKVIGAGMVPNCIAFKPVSSPGWGDWESIGYKVVTPHEYREPLRQFFLEHACALGLSVE